MADGGVSSTSTKPAAPLTLEQVAQAEREKNDCIARIAAVQINSAVAGKRWDDLDRIVNKLKTDLSTTVEGVSEGAGKELSKALSYARVETEKATKWSILEVILSIFALGIPFIVDAYSQSAAEKAKLDVHGTFERVEKRPMTAELAAHLDSPLADAFRHLPATGTSVGKARLISENVDAWSLRWTEVSKAEKSIDLDYFSLERDAYGKAMLGLVLSRMHHGVKDVRIMTDAIAGIGGPGGFTLPFYGSDYLDEMAEAGAKVAIYNPIRGRPFKLNNLGVLASNHDKILAIDGKVAFTGGRNIGNDYLSQPGDRKDAWRDMDVQLIGEGATAAMREAVRREFDREEMVSYVGKEFLGNWDRKDGELIGSYLIMDEWMKAKCGDCSALTADQLVDMAELRLPSEGYNRRFTADERKALLETAKEIVGYKELHGAINKGQELPLEDVTINVLDKTAEGNGGSIDDIGPGLIGLARKAQKSITIENPYVVLTNGMLEALEEASKRGVKINLITNSPLSTDSEITQAFFLEDWSYVLARLPTARIFVATGGRKFHTKTAAIDDEVAWVASYNADFLSGEVNSEIGAAMYSKAFAKRTREVLEADVADRSNGFLEYTIKKDEHGRAIVDKDGKPIPEFGPENHLPKKVLEHYAKKRKSWKKRANNWSTLASLKHAPLKIKDQRVVP